MAPRTAATTAQQRHDTNYYPDEGFYDDEPATQEVEADEAWSDEDPVAKPR